jgi:hypothetical protein
VDGPALTTATFNNLQGLTVNASSGAVITTEDTGGFRVRLTAQDYVRTFIGTGVVGSAVGPPLNSSFTRPLSVALDGATNALYVADFAANQVRVLAPNGTYCGVFAGAFDPALSTPAAVAVAPTVAGTQTLYVVAFNTNRVHAMDTATGAQLSVVGTGAAGAADGFFYAATFTQPLAIALDPTGALAYICDYGNQKIRTIFYGAAAGAYTVATFAGSGVAGWVDGTGTNARFQNPRYVAVDWLGNVFISETGTSNRLRVITPAGLVSTVIGGVAGNVDGTFAAASIASPTGLGFSPSAGGSARGADVLYVGSPNKIRNLTCAAVCPAGWTCNLGQSATPTVTMCPVGFYCPAGSFTPTPCPSGAYAPPASDHCRVCDPGYYCPVGADAPLACPAGRYGASASLATPTCSGACSAAAGWGCGPAATSAAGAPCPAGYWCAGGAVPPATCSCPGLCAGAATSDPDATVGNTWASATVAAYTFTTAGPRGISANSSGFLVASDDTGHKVWALSGGATKTLLAGSGFGGVVDGVGAGASFFRPLACAYDGNRYVWVVDYTAHTVRQITPGGIVKLLAGRPGSFGSSDGMGTNARFNGPRAIAAFPTGQFAAVADPGNSRVRKVYANGAVTTLPIVGAACAIGIDGYGVVYFITTSGNVGTISPSGAVSFVIGAGAPGFADGVGNSARVSSTVENNIFVDSAGTWFFGDTGNNRLRRVSQGGNVTTILGGAAGSADGYGSAAQLTSIYGVAGDGKNTLWVAAGLLVRTATCGACPAGSYCDGNSAPGFPKPCPVGAYCPAGSKAPTPCPGGLYGGVTGLSLPACSGPCNKGYYCPNGSTSPMQVPCGVGFYCPQGTGPTPLPCPAFGVVVDAAKGPANGPAYDVDTAACLNHCVR